MVQNIFVGNELGIAFRKVLPYFLDLLFCFIFTLRFIVERDPVGPFLG